MSPTERFHVHETKNYVSVIDLEAGNKISDQIVLKFELTSVMERSGELVRKITHEDFRTCNRVVKLLNDNCYDAYCRGKNKASTDIVKYVEQKFKTR